METLTEKVTEKVKTKVETKTYVLLDSMDSDAPIYQTVGNGKREQIRKIPFYRPFLQVTITDEDGRNRTLRYKAYSNSIWQDEQIKEGIDANAQFTQTERSETMFRHGYITTRKPVLQQFLEANPAFEGFKGQCEEVKAPQYKLLDKVKDTRSSNYELRLRTQAATKILSLNLPEAQAMLIRLNGSYFPTPQPADKTDDAINIATEDCQNMLMQFLDDAELPGVEAILQEDEELNIDQATNILVGKLINHNLLSFNEEMGKISKKDKSGKWIPVREIGADYSPEERLRLFIEFLNTADGKPLKDDLTKDLTKAEKAAAKQN